MEAAKIFKRFSLMSAGVWVGLALVLGTTITYLTEKRIFERTTVATLDYY